MIDIRERQKINTSQMSVKMGFDRTYWGKIESGKKPLTDETIRKFKEVLDAPLLILSEDDVLHFKNKLMDWKNAITYEELDKAKSMQAQLARTLELSPNGTMERLYNIFTIGFYRVHANFKEMDKQIAKLKKQADYFTNEEAHWYYRQVAVRAHDLLDYNVAIDAYLRAEKSGEETNLNNEGFYYNIGHCLTDMGYATTAIQYLEKALDKAVENKNHAHDVYMRIMLSANYIPTGRAADAVQILFGCLNEIKGKNNLQVIIGLIYRRIALAYSALEDFDAAIKNIDTSFDFLESGHDFYNENLYYKAVILLSAKKRQEAETCLAQGIAVTKETSLAFVMLNTLNHLLNLKKPISCEYVENIAIPKLKYHCVNVQLLDCYSKLGEHYEENNVIKSNMYFREAFALSEKLRKGNLSC